MRKLLSLMLAIPFVGFLGTAARADDDSAKTYKAHCSPCHGVDGKGQTKAGQAQHVKDWTDGKTLAATTDDQAKGFLQNGIKGDDGKQRMPPAKLTDDQITAILAYVRSTFQK